MKHRKSHIGLIILIVIIVILAVLAFWQRNNIKALLLLRHSSEELAQQYADNEKIVQEAVESQSDLNVRDLTDDEIEAYKNGEITENELIGRLTSDESGSSDNAEITEPENHDSYNDELSVLIAEVYVLRQTYINELDKMFNAAKAEYVEMQNNGASKTELVSMASDYISKATDLESECDRKIDTIVKKMSKLIKENGGDTSVPDAVVSAYANEKSIKKAEYLAMIKERGLI